jgi:hypothetical protein
MKNFNKITAAMLGLVMTVYGCKTNNEETTQVVLKDYSVNPVLVKTLSGFENLQLNTLISSDDVLPESPGFVFGAQPDGAGLIKNSNGKGYILINNHEILWSVSRVYLDETFKPVKGEYIVDGEGGGFRLCSATMATPEEHGFGPAFLTAGESGAESMVHNIDPLGTADKKNKSRTVALLGKASMENAVPLNKNAFPGKTVIMVGEDDTPGQVMMYMSNAVGDLTNGKLYMLRRTNQNQIETDMTLGVSYEVEFVEVDNAASLKGSEIAAQTQAKKAINFARVEDLDYGKGSAANNRQIYFTATGISNADKVTPVPNYNMWGRVYRLTLNETNPLAGKIEVILDGSQGSYDATPGKDIVNPDNICVTQNYVYVQEDGDSFYKNTAHDGRVWQYNIATKQLKPMIEMNHRRGDATFEAKYNSTKSNLLSSWEYGAMYDISDLIGSPNTFLLNIHPHTWRDVKYDNADGSSVTKGGSISSAFTEGGQVVIVKGVAK